jgi:plastocyanin
VVPLGREGPGGYERRVLVTVPARGAACLAAAAAVLLAVPALAQAKSKTVDMGLSASAQKRFGKKYSADVNDFFPHSVTIRAGDSVRFRPADFHTVDIPPKGQSILPLVTASGTNAGVNDASNAPFWFNGQPRLAFNPALTASNFGKRLTYSGERVESGVPVSEHLKPMTVRFPTKGTYRYFCDLHSGMSGTVVVKGKRAKVATAKQDKRRVRKQLARDGTRAKNLAGIVPPGNTVYTGGAAAGGVEYYGMLPARKTVPVGTTVRFMMAPKSFDVHTATFGPGNPLNQPTSYLGVIAKSFQGTTLDPRGIYASERPPTVANYGPTLHGNGFWNSGVLDTSDATSLMPYADLRFTTPGTYDFYCLIHPFMHGQVIVQ